MTDIPEEKPLCVDLDGTLVRTDLLFESALVLLKRNPFLVLLMPWWLVQGRAFLKREIARRAQLKIKSLPFNSEFLAWLQREHSRGRKIVLATATDEILARQVAAHCGVFAEVMASDGTTNLSGRNKRDQLVRRFGKKGFVYAGNSRVDLCIWDQAAEAVMVNGSDRLTARVRAKTEVKRVFPPLVWRASAFIKALRVHQWVKNLLIFVPLFAAHEVKDWPRLDEAIRAFFAFSFCASAIYILNDLLDLGADREHPTKQWRSFASGALPVAAGFFLIPGLLAGSFAAAWGLNGKFLVILGLYLALTVLYSFFIKAMLLGDVMCLAGLYTIRIFAGGVATAVPVSNWLLAFAMFFFLSLALAKRTSELYQLRLARRSSPDGRSYLVNDLEQLASLGTGSGCLSVLVLALYINSAEVKAFYLHPERLWFVCPLFFYWISRIWLLAHRGEIHEDPVVFALKDKVSYAVGFFILAVAVFATGM